MIVQRRKRRADAQTARSEQRTHASARAQGALVGTMAACQLFLDGTGRMLPDAGGALWWSALLCPAGALLLTLPIARMRREADGRELADVALASLPAPVALALCALCGLTLLLDAAAALYGLTELTHASLLPQTDERVIVLMALTALLLSAYAGLTGMQRLAFLLRRTLPILLLLLMAWSLWGRPIENLYPLAGHGVRESLRLGAGSLGAGACALAAGFLPGGVRQLPQVRARETCGYCLSGHLLAVLLLLGLSLSTPYSLWPLAGGWGARMVLQGRPALYNGILYRMVTVLQLTALLIAACGALLFAAHALSRAMRGRRDRLAFALAFALLTAAGLLRSHLGLSWLLAAMPWRYAAALAVVWLPFLARRQPAGEAGA